MTYNSHPSDFGWAETSYHRNPEDKEISTPTMDALVKSGVELNRHYVHMMCTPSRASFYSGRLPVQGQRKTMAKSLRASNSRA